MNGYWKDLPVIVTGAAGFIGSHIARELVGLGARVNAIVRPGSYLWRLEDIAGRVKIFETDITNSEDVYKAVKKISPKVIFHLAAVVNVSRSPDVLPQIMDINFQGTVNLLNALDKDSLDSFINTGSSEEYGTNKAPLEENLREKPVSPYSFSKTASTYYCQMLHRTQGWPIVTVRPFVVYGPYQTGSMLVPALMEHCCKGGKFPLTPGEQTRNFTYISDVVQGYLKAAVSKEAFGEVINLGGEKEYTIKKVVSLGIKLSKSALKPEFGAFPYRVGEAMRFFCSGEKAYKVLGWKPKVALEQGLAETVAWYQKWYKEQHGRK